MKKLLKFLLCLTAPLSFSQNLELDAELIEINFHGSSDVDDFFIFNDKVYFTASNGLHGREIWYTDGEETHMLTDTISASTYPEGGLHGTPIIFNDNFYFVGQPQNFSNLPKGLFKSNGTPEGINLILSEVENYQNNSNFSGISRVGDEVFFFYDDGIHGLELWKTNGTVENTSLIKDLNVGNGGLTLSNITIVGNKYYFIADDGIHGNELWVSDGTDSGTFLVKDIRPGSIGSGVLNLFELSNAIYFIANDGTNGAELWRSDGTEAGTYLLKNINSGNLSAFDPYSVNNFLVFDDFLYFFANDGNRPQLWKTDGTMAGTAKFMDVNSYGVNENTNLSRSIIGMSLENEFVFVVYEYDGTSKYNYKLWRSDGSVSGTTPIFDFEINESLFYYSFETYQIDGKSFISYNFSNNNDKSLWQTDGTSDGTNFLIGNYYHFSDFKSFGNATYIKAGIDYDDSKILKLADGSTNPIIFMDNVINSNADFINYNGKIYYSNFYLNNDEYYHPSGSELWTMNFDGSDSEMIKDINLESGSNTGNFKRIFDKTVFDGRNGNDVGLFISDGTANGTNFLKDVQIETSNGTTQTQFYKVGNQYFFRARFHEQFAPFLLFKTDGTSNGTSLITDIVTPYYANYNQTFEVHNEKLYFVGGEPESGNLDLWVSDGSESGTSEVYSFSNEEINYILYNSIQSFGDFVYFTVSITYNDGNVSRGLWKTDGTPNGTELIYEAPYEFWFEEDAPFILGVIDNKLIFEVYNKHEIGYPDSYIEVFALNENSETPELIYSGNGLPYSGAYEVNSSIYFQDIIYMPTIMFDSSNEWKMTFLKTDGTAQGTELLSPNNAIEIKDMKVCGDYLYFKSPSIISINQLWRTNGAAGGTIKLREIANDGYIDNSVCHKNNLYYSVYENSSEQSNYVGTLEVTNGVYNQHQKISINRVDNEPINQINELYSDGDLLYLTISERIHGNEIYVSDPDIVLSMDEINEGLTNKSSKFLIYPNPTSSEINIVPTDKSKIQQIQLYDLTGKLLELGMYNSIEVKLNLSKYSAGIYLVKVKTEKNTSTQKVILK